MSQPTPEELAERVDELTALVESQQAWIEQRQQEELVESTHPSVTRRRLFGLAGAGAAAAVGSAVLATPAGAANGDNLVIGANNEQGATSQTRLDYTPAARVGSGSPTKYNASFEVRHTNPANDSIVIQATTFGTGRAFQAITTNSNSNEPAVWAQHAGTVAAIHGFASGTGGGVVAQLTSVSNSSAAVLGTTAGLGSALSGRVTNPSSTAAAVTGETSGAGAGLQAVSTGGLGVVANGGRAPLRLVPGSGTGAPSSGSHQAGELFVDDQGDIFLCKADGDPGTWFRLTDQDTDTDTNSGPRFLPVSVRAFDSRVDRDPIGTGPGPKGVFAPGETRVVDLSKQVDVSGGVSALLVNLTLTGTTGSGGYVSVYSADRPTQNPPSFSSINWFGPNQNVANNSSFSIGNDGKIKVYASGSTHVIVDVIARYFPL